MDDSSATETGGPGAARLAHDSVMRPDSPCIAQCSTSLGDEICNGCGRHFMDVINWNVMGAAEKQAIWERIEQEGYGARWRRPGAPAVPAPRQRRP